MADADLDGPTHSHVPTQSPRRSRPLWLQGMACLAIVPLLGFIGQNGRQLWGEFRSLQEDQGIIRATEIVGYLEINPAPSFAKSPNGWIHSEGETTQLWAGWKKGRHHWYTLAPGDIDPRRFSTPLGKDVIRSIDVPIYEKAGELRWGRVPQEALVASFDRAGETCALPLTVLDKVEMVNHQSGESACLVLFTPVEDSVVIYDATLDGERLTFGHGGYFLDFHPVLYDRGTESLWTEQDNALVAVSGPRRGASLKRIARLEVVPWSAWKADHPEGKLLVGADRSKPKPAH